MSLFTRIMATPVALHGAATVAAFFGLGAVQGRLDALYAQSNHPVDYATGQTTFDAVQIKGFYADMQGEGTLDVYMQTQQFDFLFLACMGLFGLLFGTFVARFARTGSWGRKSGLFAAGLAVFGALCDATENLISFVMLTDPQGFLAWLALPYSGFAVVKFGAIALAMLTVLVAIILVAFGRATDRPTIA